MQYNSSPSFFLLQEKDWERVERDFKGSKPLDYVVVDQFFDTHICNTLQKQLAHHWAWRLKDPQAKHLHNIRPKITMITDIANELKRKLPNVLGHLELDTHWAIMNHKNTSGRIHFDDCKLVVSLWLTPDEYNLNPQSGGLFLYDVHKNSKESWKGRFTSQVEIEDYVKTNLKKEIYIPYKWNRAVIFDPRNLHAAGSTEFKNDHVLNYRLNLTLAFD